VRLMPQRLPISPKWETKLRTKGVMLFMVKGRALRCRKFRLEFQKLQKLKE
jgi:hypothetical protein